MSSKPENDYQRVEAAIHYLRAHAKEQPTLEVVADHLHLSPFHFQRIFTQWAGISPKRFLELITVSHAKTLLNTSSSVLGAAYEVGLSGAGRLHDHFVNLEAMSPGEFKRGGAQLTLTYGVHASCYGDYLIALTERGICHLSFLQQAESAEIAILQSRWPNARLNRDQSQTAFYFDGIFRFDNTAKKGLTLHVKGTNFQIQVWRALLNIPAGGVVSYQAVADSLGRPKSVRAVANAVGSNSIAALIPCHRVLRSDGQIGGYRWGVDRKCAILGRELAQARA